MSESDAIAAVAAVPSYQTASERHRLPFDVPAALVALAFVESGYDPAAVGDGGTSFGAWQIHDDGVTWRSMIRTYPGPDIFAQAKWMELFVERKASLVSRMGRELTRPGVSFDARDAVKWMDYAWQHSEAACLAFAKTSGTTDTPATERRAKFLEEYNRLEDRSAHPIVTMARDAADAGAKAVGAEVRGALYDSLALFGVAMVAFVALTNYTGRRRRR